MGKKWREKERKRGEEKGGREFVLCPRKKKRKVGAYDWLAACRSG